MRWKSLWKLYPIVIILSIIIFFERKSSSNQNIFFENKLNSKIVEIKNNWSGGRSYDYLTIERIVITLRNSDSLNLKVSDSVVKEKKSWKFDVFRIDQTGNYKFFKQYDLIKQ